MRSLELTRRGILGTLAVLVAAGVCIRLGIWQLDRRAERQAYNEAVAARMSRPPTTLEAAPLDTAGLTYRRVTLTGTVDDDRAVVLAGRSRNGAPGVDLLSPLRLGGDAVLVNRGWLPAADAATVDIDAVRLRGSVRVAGLLMPFPEAGDDEAPAGFKDTWFRFNGTIRSQYPYPVAPLYLRATAPPEPAGPGTLAEPGNAAGTAAAPTGPGPDKAQQPVPLDPPELDSGPHLSYAIQWFSFATIFVVGWLVLLVRGTGATPDEDGAGD